MFYPDFENSWVLISLLKTSAIFMVDVLEFINYVGFWIKWIGVKMKDLGLKYRTL